MLFSKLLKTTRRSILALVYSFGFIAAASGGESRDEDAAYWNTVPKRAEKIVSSIEIKDEAVGSQAKVYALHYAFLAKLSAELNQEQVEQVKDGMTNGVVPNTYHRYMPLLSDLDDEHKRYIYAALVEAREHAMVKDHQKKSISDSESIKVASITIFLLWV